MSLYFASKYVAEGNFDKLCDQFSDAILVPRLKAKLADLDLRRLDYFQLIATLKAQHGAYKNHWLFKQEMACHGRRLLKIHEERVVILQRVWHGLKT